VDANYPGVWGLLTHSVVAGITTNNVDRWGPCGAKVLVNGIGQTRGGEWGCIDQTLPKAGTSITGGEFRDRGYPSPDWPMYGFLIYDGPPLIVKDHFVTLAHPPPRNPRSLAPPPRECIAFPPVWFDRRNISPSRELSGRDSVCELGATGTESFRQREKSANLAAQLTVTAILWSPLIENCPRNGVNPMGFIPDCATIRNSGVNLSDIGDSLADEAVWCELLSASNSLIIRENTGNFRHLGHPGAALQPNKLYLLSGFWANSLLNGTGNFETRTGNYFGGTGNFLRTTGKPLWGSFRWAKWGDQSGVIHGA
jgi:hypothetical protein